MSSFYNERVRPGDQGTGAVFKNKKQEKPSHPDYIGDCEVDGVPYQIRAWIMTDKNGDKFLSLGFRAVSHNELAR